MFERVAGALFQNGGHFSILLFDCKLTLLALFMLNILLEESESFMVSVAK